MVRFSIEFNIALDRSGIGRCLGLRSFGFFNQIVRDISTNRFINQKSFKLFIGIIIGSIKGINIMRIEGR